MGAGPGWLSATLVDPVATATTVSRPEAAAMGASAAGAGEHGGGAREVEQYLTQPIERALQDTPELDSLSSYSAPGESGLPKSPKR